MDINNVNPISFKCLNVGFDLDSGKRDYLSRTIYESSACRKAINEIEKYSNDVYVENYSTANNKKSIEINIKDSNYDKYGRKINDKQKKILIRKKIELPKSASYRELSEKVKEGILQIYNLIYSS